MAQKRGRKEGIFPEGIILEKGQAQKTMQNPWSQALFGGPPEGPCYMGKSGPKRLTGSKSLGDVSGFSNFWGLFQVIMANPVFGLIMLIAFLSKDKPLKKRKSESF